MSASALPSKLFFRIGEVASLVGVEPHVLRYWEREFRSIRPTKSAKGQRVYSRKDVENLLRVRDLLYRDGFTIAGAKKRLQRGPVASVAEASPSVATAEASPSGERATDTSRDLEAYADAESEPEDEELVAAEPESGPRAHDSDPSMREKLTALRAEVEAFLGELDAGELA
jgi:DNA-binding transcriptional MerR regulator